MAKPSKKLGADARASNDGLMTEAQAAEKVLQIPERTLADYRRKGFVESAVFQVGKHVRYCPEKLKACFAPQGDWQTKNEK